MKDDHSDYNVISHIVFESVFVGKKNCSAVIILIIESLHIVPELVIKWHGKKYRFKQPEHE